MCRERKRNRFLVSLGANPEVLRTIETYCFGNGMEVVPVPLKDGKTDPEALSALLGDDAAGFYLAQPNFFGLLEDAEALGAIAHEKGAKFVMGVNPIALGLLKTPAECGADVAVGEGQPLGMPLSFGGPYLGFMAATPGMMRRLPGRIVGETVDRDGKRAFVLTLQAREQHIRREKASSNICSNEALCAMTAAVYLAAMGPEGLAQVATLCASKAHALAGRISALPGFALRYKGEFFHEFVTECPIAPEALNVRLAEKGILGGWPVDGGILWCATEMNTAAQLDALVSALSEVRA